jgi:hypothetical protein
MGKYFTVEVKPTIAASKQHAGAIVAGDVLFDWTSFEIPRGGAMLRGITITSRPKGDAGPTPNNFGMHFLFGKHGSDPHSELSSTSSIGDPGDIAFLTTKNNGAGIIGITGANLMWAGPKNAISTSSLSVGHDTTNIMFDSTYSTGTNAGYDKYYVAAISNQNDWDFSSINAIAESGAAEAASTQVITMDGTSMDVREHFQDGDVVHIGTSAGTPAADSLIGTVASADSTTQITLDAVSPTELVDGDILYNINPIKLILHFEI